MAGRKTAKTPDAKTAIDKLFGRKKKPPLPDPYKPLKDKGLNKHVEFLKRAAEGTVINDLLAGFGIAKDFQVVYGLADELNNLEVGKPMEWDYWPSTYDEDGAIVLDPKGPYTLKVERITETTPLKKFRTLGNTNFGWVWDPVRKQFVWQIKS